MKRFWVYVLLILVFAQLTLNFSPLGLSDRGDKYIQDLFNTHAGRLVYGAPQDDITVLLLTDEVISSYQRGHWPASYDFHGKVLNAVLHEKPKAVFIDFLWMSQRPETAAGTPRDGDYLVKVLQRYHRGGIPVYLASTPEVRRNWGEFEGLVTHVGAELSIDPVDFVSRTYPPATKTSLQTPAFRIAQDVRPDMFPQKPTEPMDVFWGTAPNEKNDWMKVEEHDDNILSVALNGFSGVKTSVPFSTTVYARDVLMQVGDTPEEVRKQAASLMKDKIILYGANLTGVNDLIFTPTRDILPGVYLHAMALDNLLHWGNKYKSVGGKGLLANSTLYAVCNLLIVLPVAILLAFFHRRPDVDTSGGCDRYMTGMPVSEQGPFRANARMILYTLCIWRLKVWELFEGHKVLGKLCVMLALVCWFTAWGAIQFIYFNISVSTVAGYLAFLTLGFFLDKVGMADWLIDHAYPWTRKAYSRIARIFGKSQP